MDSPRPWIAPQTLRVAAVALTLACLAACQERTGDGAAATKSERAAGQSSGAFRSGARVDSLIRPGETHFTGLIQLTNGGENAEAYWSWDGKNLILQATPRDRECDQIYIVPANGGELQMVSNGKGRCTCSYFLPGDRKILYSSTYLDSPACPPKPDYSMGYVWAIYRGYDIFTADRDGGNIVRLTDTPGYDAEATIGPDGTIIFTSVRDGDLDLYTMRPDGSDVRRLTDTPGYDGGAFFSPDGSKICYRASHPTDPAELEDYRNLLSQGLIRPGKLDIYIMNADGTGVVRLTDNGAANFCPFFHPNGKEIIFASNMEDPNGRNFDLFMVDIDGGHLERLTFEETFDGFPMFSPDGKRLAFASNRNEERQGETNIFVADWKD